MNNYILRMENITKVFGDVVANDKINLKVKKGEIHAIIGENGAGKSTLMKILNGLYSPDYGKIFINENEEEISNPSKASELGIGMVYQHFMLIPNLTVVENMILGNEIKKRGILDLKSASTKVKEVSRQYGLQIDPNEKIYNLSVGKQQRVEILKILFKNTKIFVFDEPTAVLTPPEVKEFYKIMKFLQEAGNTIIFITHKLQEVMDIADNITVMRNGTDVAYMQNKNVTKEILASAMVGRKILFDLHREKVIPGKKLLELQNISCKNDKGLKALENVNFDVKTGEILGIAGVNGNGQTELEEILLGLRKINNGEIILNSANITNRKNRDITKLGMANIPEDRHKRAAIDEYSVAYNLAFGVHKDKYQKLFNLNEKKLKTESKKLIKEYDIRPANENAVFGGLSGGNQQKVIVAREMEKEHKVLIASQPTRGVDVGAIEFIHNLILKERELGKAVLLISAELSEIMSLSDRIAVIYEGKIVGILKKEEANEQKLGILMSGGTI